MGNAQHKIQTPPTSIKRRKSSVGSLTGAISKFHSKQSSSVAKDVMEKHDFSSATASGISRSASGTDITEKNYSQFIPTERLAKILQQKSHQEVGVNGIVCDVFMKNVFPEYPDLGSRFFKYLHKASRAKTKHLGATAFRQQCEIYLSIYDEALIFEHYVKIFCGLPSITSDESEDDLSTITQSGLTSLLTVCYRIAMSNYGNTLSNNQLSFNAYNCPYLDRTMLAVTQSCFFTKDSLSVGFVCRWLEQNCPRLILPLHHFCVHTITTVYRRLEGEQSNDENAQVDASREKEDESGITIVAGQKKISLELATPVLDNVKSPFSRSSDASVQLPHLMPLSQAWLLAGSLPALYTRPQQSAVHRSDQQQSKGQPSSQSPQETEQSHSAIGLKPSNNNLNSTTSSTPNSFMNRLLSIVPSHWTMLYDSFQHGVGANRFLHHVLGYRGPTLLLLHSKTDELFCIAAPAEWRETHLYTGDKECQIMQLLPKFCVIEKGPKLLYLNTSIRGYPKGLRAGSDPRKPLLSIDEQFETLEYRGVSTILVSIEVWGCGDKQSRDVQLDIKKWQVKEAERQRTVKLTAADWIDHPDRYLLELGGRPQYNNSN